METRIYFPPALTCGELLALLVSLDAEYVGTGVSATISIEMPGGVFVAVLVGILIGVLVDVGSGEGEAV